MNGGGLSGLRIMVTRPRVQGEALAERIRRAGGHALAWPLLEIRPYRASHDQAAIDVLRSQLGVVEQFDKLLFVSANAVREAMHWLREIGVSPASLPSCCAVGRTSAEVLAGFGVQAVCAPGSMDTEALLAMPELDRVAGQRLLICRGEGGRTLLAETLRQRGARVDECALYRRQCPEYKDGVTASAMQAQRINVVQLASGETLSNFISLLGPGSIGPIMGGISLIVPGARVGALAEQAGFRHIRIAKPPTDEGIISVLREIAETNGSETAEPE